MSAALPINFLFMILTILGASLASIGSSIFLGLWVYNDAKDRNIDSPTIWVVLAVLTGVIGLVVYVVVRNSQKPKWICMQCGVANGSESVHCVHCGQQRPATLPGQATATPNPKTKRYLYWFIGCIIASVALFILYFVFVIGLAVFSNMMY